MTLNLLGEGKQAVILKVTGRGELRSRLLDMGFVPGTVVRVHKRLHEGTCVIITLLRYTAALRSKDVKCIFVKEV